MNNVRVEKNNNNGILRVTKGLLISFIISLVSIFAFSIILTYTNISEAIIPISIVTITFISILVASIINTRNLSKNGMLNGGVIGGIYVALLYLISSITNTGFNLNMYTILMLVLGIMAGLIGGIVGINT